MTDNFFTAYDTDFDLTDVNDCVFFMQTLETFGKIWTWQLYDLLCEVDHIEGNEQGYNDFLDHICNKFGNVIDRENEICLDDCAAKTILSQYSSAIDRHFRSNAEQPFISVSSHVTPDMLEEVERIVFECFGTASEDNYVPVQQVEILQKEPHFVTRVIEPVRDAKTGLTRIGNIGNFSVQVYTVNIKGRITANFGLQHPDPDAVVTDEIQEIAQSLFEDFQKVA